MRDVHLSMDYCITSYPHEEIDMSDLMHAMQDPDCVGLFVHDDAHGNPICFEVWNSEEVEEFQMSDLEIEEANERLANPEN